MIGHWFSTCVYIPIDAVFRRGSRRAFQRWRDVGKLIISAEADLPSPQSLVTGNRPMNSTTSLLALPIASSASSDFIADEISPGLREGIMSPTSVAFISKPD